MKNELILARFTGQYRPESARRLLALLEQFGLLELLATRYPLLNTVEQRLAMPSGSAQHPAA